VSKASHPRPGFEEALEPERAVEPVERGGPIYNDLFDLGYTDKQIMSMDMRDAVDLAIRSRKKGAKAKAELEERVEEEEIPVEVVEPQPGMVSLPEEVEEEELLVEEPEEELRLGRPEMQSIINERPWEALAESKDTYTKKGKKIIDRLRKMYPNVKTEMWKRLFVTETNGRYTFSTAPVKPTSIEIAGVFFAPLRALVWSASKAYIGTPPHEYFHRYNYVFKDDPVIARATRAIIKDIRSGAVKVPDEMIEKTVGKTANELLAIHVESYYADRLTGNSKKKIGIYLRTFWARLKQLLHTTANKSSIVRALSEWSGLDVATITKPTTYQLADIAAAKFFKHKDVLDVVGREVMTTPLLRRIRQNPFEMLLEIKPRSFELLDRMAERGEVVSNTPRFFNRLAKIQGLKKEEIQLYKDLMGVVGEMPAEDMKTLILERFFPIKMLQEFEGIAKEPKPVTYHSIYSVPGGLEGSYREWRLESPIGMLVGHHPRFITENMLGWARTDIDAETGAFRVLEVQAADFLKRLDDVTMRGRSADEVSFINAMSIHINHLLIRSIIQLAARQGHTKLRFPEGLTAARKATPS